MRLSQATIIILEKVNEPKLLQTTTNIQYKLTINKCFTKCKKIMCVTSQLQYILKQKQMILLSVI